MASSAALFCASIIAFSYLALSTVFLIKFEFAAGLGVFEPGIALAAAKAGADKRAAIPKILAHGIAAANAVRIGTNLEIPVAAALPAREPNRLDRNPPLDGSFAACFVPPAPAGPIFLIASNSASSRNACSFATSSAN